MKSLLTVALVGLLGLQALGLDTLLVTRECEEGCPTDGSEGSCAPFCPDCVCCPTLRSFVQPEPAGLPLSLATRATRFEAQSVCPVPPAGDIFHVPRASLT